MVFCYLVNEKSLQIKYTSPRLYLKRNIGQFIIGIKFKETAERNIWLIRALVRSYHYNKDKTRSENQPKIGIRGY